MSLFSILSSPDVRAAPTAVPERPLVVLIDPHGSPIARRLKQEIEALGFEVSIRAKSVSALDQELLSARVIAAIEVRPALPGQVELVMVDPQTAGLVRQRLPIQAQQDPTGADLVATRTVELLRAARLELEAQRRRDVPAEPTSPPPSEAELAPNAELLPAGPELGDQDTSLFRLGSGGAVGFTSPWSVSPSVWLGLSWLAAPHWAATAEVLLPLAPAHLTSSEGTADASSTTYRLGVALESSRERRFGVGARAGVQLEWLSFRGHAQEGYSNAESQLWTWGPWLGANTSASVTPKLRAVAGVAASTAFMHTIVRFAGREVDRFGQPAFSAALGMEWTP